MAELDPAQLLAALGQASAFDLYRLHSALGRLLDDPERLHAVKQTLRVGQTIEYYVPVQNRTVAAQVLKLQRTRVEVADLAGGKRWSVPYYAIQLDASAAAPSSTLTPHSLSVGDWVGFVDQHGIEHSGQVRQLNRKTVTVQSASGRWRVAYPYLFRILSSDTADPSVMPQRSV